MVPFDNALSVYISPYKNLSSSLYTALKKNFCLIKCTLIFKITITYNNLKLSSHYERNKSIVQTLRASLCHA